MGDTDVRKNAHVKPSAAGAASEPGLHSSSSSGVANSQVREPKRLITVERRIQRAWSRVSLSLKSLAVNLDPFNKYDVSATEASVISTVGVITFSGAFEFYFPMVY
jgi:hypothetical protein